MPPGLDIALSWDLSPLRPWEYWQQDACEWTEAVALRNAFDEGVRSVKASAEQKARSEERRKALIEKKLGKRGG